MMQDVETVPHEWQWPTYPIQSIDNMADDDLVTEGVNVSAATVLTYCKISNIRRTKLPQTVSHLVLQLSLPNPIKPGV